MDWYHGCGINDFLVPEDQDLLDRHPSPDSSLKWGIRAPEGFDSPKKFLIMDTSATELEFDFIDESFSNEIELEPSLHDKDQSSSSSVCGGLAEQSFQQIALSCDQPNYQLQDLSSFKQMDDIFLDSVLEDLPCVENLHKSFYFYPENHCSNTPGGLQKDIEASKFVPCNSNSNDFLDIEALIVEDLDPFEQCSRDEAMHEQSSLEESILQNLEMVIAQFTKKTRICFRDALYRLARNTEQQHVVENLDEGDLNIQKAMPQVVPNETVRSEDKKPMESKTNNVDRAVANLMFNKMEINMPDLPLTSVNSKQEVIGSKGLHLTGSKALNPAQKFHCPLHQILQGDAEVPQFGQRDQQPATESHIACADPIKKSFLLEFG